MFFVDLFWWVVAPWQFVWRVPLFVVGVIVSVAIWKWLFSVVGPWIGLAFRIVFKGFEKIGVMLSWIPKKSKALADRIAHKLGVCDGPYICTADDEKKR